MANNSHKEFMITYLNILAFMISSSNFVCKISLSFRFRISLSDMTNYKSVCGKVCRIKNRHTFKNLPICNSSYHDAVKYAELRIGILLKVCRFVIRHITQTDTETETELLRRHQILNFFLFEYLIRCKLFVDSEWLSTRTSFQLEYEFLDTSEP